MKHYSSFLQVVEREDSVAAGASSGNSGLGCTGYDAPVGSLERRLLRRSIRIHQNLYRSFGLSREHVNKCGSLVVAWTPEELEKLKGVMQENVDAGDTDVELLSVDELREMEPSLSRDALGAVFLPHEAVVEPWLVPMAYAESARRLGAVILTSTNVVDLSFDKVDGLWSVLTTECRDSSSGRSAPGALLVPSAPDRHSAGALQLKDGCAPTSNITVHKARVVINCAGLFGDNIEYMMRRSLQVPNTNDDFVITPRKGQFVVFDPNNSELESNAQCLPPKHIIEQVATQFTKGLIVWTTVYGNVIVGPTAVNVTDKTDRSTDIETINMLRSYGERVIPSLKYARVVGTYSGLRPSTQYRDYQIYALPDQHWITVGGIRSTGLSASSGIGEYVGNLYWSTFNTDKHLTKNPQSASDTPELLGVTDSAAMPEPIVLNRRGNLTSMHVPTLAELADSYKACNRHRIKEILHNDATSKFGKDVHKIDRSEGTVLLFDRESRVTHPIASFGIETYQNSLKQKKLMK